MVVVFVVIGLPVVDLVVVGVGGGEVIDVGEVIDGLFVVVVVFVIGLPVVDLVVVGEVTDSSFSLIKLSKSK